MILITILNTESSVIVMDSDLFMNTFLHLRSGTQISCSAGCRVFQSMSISLFFWLEVSLVQVPQSIPKAEDVSSSQMGRREQWGWIAQRPLRKMWESATSQCSFSAEHKQRFCKQAKKAFLLVLCHKRALFS